MRSYSELVRGAVIQGGTKKLRNIFWGAEKKFFHQKPA